MRDIRFVSDRADFFNHRFPDPGSRPDAVNEIRRAAELLESSLLSDGRQFLLGTDGPSMADVEAVWPFVWLTSMPGALPAEQFQFPRVLAWMGRFKAAVSAARKGKAAPDVDASQALAIIVGSPFYESEGVVDAADGVVQHHGFVKGQKVSFWPLDTGSSGRDVGKLVSIDSREVVIETETEARGGVVRVHAPRHGFRVRPGARRRPELVDRPALLCFACVA